MKSKLPRHRVWLWAVLMVLSLGVQAQCQPSMGTALLERFVPADCEVCWSVADLPAATSQGAVFVLDWIVPSALGEAAPLSAASVAEAAARSGPLVPGRTLQRQQALPAREGWSLAVQDGPAWNGYVALQLRVEGRGKPTPAGAVGFLALVELVPPGEDGTPVARRLVRSLAGPLPLNATQTDIVHLRALRVPFGAKAERLSSVGWIESPSGKVLALAQATDADCVKAK